MTRSMLTPDEYEMMRNSGAEVWAKMCNQRAKLNLDAAHEEALTFWFANAMQAAEDRALSK